MSPKPPKWRLGSWCRSLRLSTRARRFGSALATAVIKSALSSMVIDGIYYALALTAGGAVVWYFAQPVFAVPMFLLAAFCLYFFRDPDRAIPDGPVAVSPADGKLAGILVNVSSPARISI